MLGAPALRSLFLCALCGITSVAAAQFRPPGRYEPVPTTFQNQSPGHVNGTPFYQRPEATPHVTAERPRNAILQTGAEWTDPAANRSNHTTWPTHTMHEPTRGDVRLIRPPSGYDPVHPTAYQSPDTLELPDTIPPPTPSVPPRRQKLWQPHDACEEDAGQSMPWIAPYKTTLRTTVLPGNGDDLGLTGIDGRVTLAIPSWRGFTITPGTIVTFVDGPTRTDLPSELYSVWVEFGYMKKLNEKWAMQLAISPGLYTDFEEVDSDSVRIVGRALAFYNASEATQWAFGVVYLDRENVAALPAAGLIHQPNERTRFEVIFPRPRALFRVVHTESGEGWLYLAGEFGGGSWSIQRASGASDVITYNDLRFITGFEWRAGEKRRMFVEGGWVFERQLEYESGVGDFDPDQTGLVRAGLVF